MGASGEGGNVCIGSLLKMMVEKWLGKDRKLYIALKESEMYDENDRKGSWDILRIYGMGRKWPEGIPLGCESICKQKRVSSGVARV